MADRWQCYDSFVNGQDHVGRGLDPESTSLPRLHLVLGSVNSVILQEGVRSQNSVWAQVDSSLHDPVYTVWVTPVQARKTWT